MHELIKINYDTEQPMVSARDLHEGLEIGTRFNDWFPRMTEYGFSEGKDFYSKMSKTSESGGRPSVDYHCQFVGVQVVEQQKVIEELQPKASYYDMILQCKDLIATTVIAKDYGMSAKKFNVMLHDMGIQFKQGDTWVLYAKYQGNGYLKAKTCNYADTEGVQHSREHSYWTQKGRLFLYDFLKQQGVLPVVDMQPYKA